MKLNPKITLGVSVCILLLIISSILIYTIIKSGNRNWLYLNSANNKFKVNFQINPKSQTNFESALKSLNLPTSTQNGIEFKLDATSSAEFSYFSPIKTSLQFSPKSISFKGTLSHFQSISEAKPQSIKVPSTTVFAIFAPDLSTFLKKQYQFTADQNRWLSDNLGSSVGQYLVIFAPKEFAIYFKNDQIKLDNLNSFEKESSAESITAENLPGNRKIYPLNVVTKNNQEAASVILFQTGQWNVITTTTEAAKIIDEAQSAQGTSLDFENSIAKEPASFVLLFQNKDKNLSKDLLRSFIEITDSNNFNESKILDVLYNVSQASLTLKQDHFSGLIKFK